MRRTVALSFVVHKEEMIARPKDLPPEKPVSVDKHRADATGIENEIQGGHSHLPYLCVRKKVSTRKVKQLDRA